MSTCFKFVLLVFFWSITLRVNSQSIEWNRAIILKGMLPSGISRVDTVPVGKVWKIQAVALTAGVHWRSDVGGGNYILLGNGDAEPLTNNEEFLQNVIWFPEGEEIILDSGGVDGKYWFSILEFNANQ